MTFVKANDRPIFRARRSGVARRAYGLRPRLRPTHGQAATELAIVLPIIMLIILGILDFGRAYNYKNDLTNLANQALRYAEVNNCPAGGPGCPSISTYVQQTADSGELQHGGSGLGIQSPGVQITFCLPAGSSGAVGDPLQATASANYQWLPFLGFGTTAIRSTAIGRIEVAPDGSAPTYSAPSCSAS
jgi:TadE-like protein